MTMYKRTIMKLIQSILLLPLAPAAIFFVMLWAMQMFDYTWFFVLTIAAPVLVLLFGLYNIIWGDNIKFEISDSGQCDYFCGGKLKESFDLKVCEIGYHRVKDANGGLHSLRLRITKDGKTSVLDCEPLGNKQFERMFDQMEGLLAAAPSRLEPTAAEPVAVVEQTDGGVE